MKRRRSTPTSADNDLAGFQTGGDVWIGLLQGVRIGLEGKVGMYNNHYTLDNIITTDPFGTTPPTLDERFDDNQAAFIAEPVSTWWPTFCRAGRSAAATKCCS